jgi:hypothetical protein
MPTVTLYDGKMGKYDINTDFHKVENPERAEKKFSKELYLKVVKWLILGPVCVVILVMFIVPAWKLHFTGKIDPEFLRIVRNMDLWFIVERPWLLGFLSMIVVVFTFYFPFIVFKTLNRADKEFSRNTALETIKTFIETIELDYWKVAYNCLTDTAKEADLKDFVLDPDLKKRLSNFSSSKSLEYFKKYWKDTSINVQWFEDKIEVEEINEKTTLLWVPIQYKLFTNIIRGTSILPMDETDPRYKTLFCIKEAKCPFLAIQKGKYWFLCNSYLIIEKDVPEALYSITTEYPLST